MPGLRVAFVSHLILTASLQDPIFPSLLKQNLGSRNLFKVIQLLSGKDKIQAESVCLQGL